MSFPPTQPQPVIDQYHGISVEDPYRWLEIFRRPGGARAGYKPRTNTPAPISTRSPSAPGSPSRSGDLRGASSPEYFGLAYAGKKLFALKRQPPLQQPLLVTLSSADDLSSEQIILDPNQLDPSGGTNIDFFVPSHDARLVAVSLSQKGSEAGGVSIYEVSSGSPLSDSVPRVNNPTAGGSLAWNGDASGFYYTRYPRGDERPAEDRDFYQQVYFHLLGTPSDQDTYVIGSDFPRIAEIQLESSADGRFVLANVLNGDGGEIAHYIRGPFGPVDPGDPLRGPGKAGAARAGRLSLYALPPGCAPGQDHSPAAG